MPLSSTCSIATDWEFRTEVIPGVCAWSRCDSGPCHSTLAGHCREVAARVASVVRTRHFPVAKLGDANGHRCGRGSNNDAALGSPQSSEERSLSRISPTSTADSPWLGQSASGSLPGASPYRIGSFNTPPARQQPQHLRPGESIVNEVRAATVRRGSNDSPGGLHNLANAGEQTRVFVAGTERSNKPSPQFLVDRVELGHAQRCDESADQSGSDQVDALCKRTSEHGESNTPAIDPKPRQKRLAFRLIHSPALLPHRHGGVQRGEFGCHLLQVFKAAEDRNVVSGHRLVLRCDAGPTGASMA